MTKKSFPKLIRPTGERRKHPRASAHEQAEPPKDESAPEGLASEPVEASTSAADERPDAEPGRALVAPRAANANAMQPRASADMRRRAARWTQAYRIVERHRLYAAAGGLLPLPVVSVAGVTAIIMRMVHELSRLYSVPFEHDRTRSIVTGLVGGAVPTGLGAATTSAFAFVTPASGLLGCVVSALAAAAMTRTIGRVFVEDFELRDPSMFET